MEGSCQALACHSHARRLPRILAPIYACILIPKMESWLACAGCQTCRSSTLAVSQVIDTYTAPPLFVPLPIGMSPQTRGLAGKSLPAVHFGVQEWSGMSSDSSAPFGPFLRLHPSLDQTQGRAGRERETGAEKGTRTFERTTGP